MLLNFMVTAIGILSRLPKPGLQKPVSTAQDTSPIPRLPEPSSSCGLSHAVMPAALRALETSLPVLALAAPQAVKVTISRRLQGTADSLVPGIGWILPVPCGYIL